MKTVFFIRLDKIGDLVATLPVDQLLEPKEIQVQWILSEGLGTIAQHATPTRKFHELAIKKPNRKKTFFQLVRLLRREKPYAVLIFQAPWWVAFACWLARVPLRAGRVSQWYSLLFFNQGVRQSRSESKMHEADYNRELVQATFPESAKQQFTDLATPILQLSAAENPALLLKLNLKPENYYVVHPGMFGSALNWPQEKYNALIEKLIQTYPVLITGTRSDERFLDEIKLAWAHHPRVQFAIDFLTLPELLSTLKMAKAVVAPSTGVLHLAASLGTPAIGIYSPIQVHHPRRWGPRGAKIAVLLPKFAKGSNCPAKIQCLQEACPHFPCMASIEVDDILHAINRLVKNP